MNFKNEYAKYGIMRCYIICFDYFGILVKWSISSMYYMQTKNNHGNINEMI